MATKEYPGEVLNNVERAIKMRPEPHEAEQAAVIAERFTDTLESILVTIPELSTFWERNPRPWNGEHSLTQALLTTVFARMLQRGQVGYVLADDPDARPRTMR